MDGVPVPEDHLTVNILVRQIGSRNSAVFNRLVERLARQRIIQVSENPRRLFHARFITSVNNELVKFADLHLHHRIFGFVGVACEQPSTSSGDLGIVDELPPALLGSRRKSSVLNTSPVPIEDVRANFDRVKDEYSSHILDSRCLCIGYDDSAVSHHFSSREVFTFPSLEESDELETGIREFLRAIYFVLESKRVDVSFEKLDTPICPVLPEEEKFRIGLENKSSKTYKRKSIGRSRKQNADYALLTGLPQLALDSYSAAAELLKSSNDLLWLAAAYEGWACAATILRFELGSQEEAKLPRISSMTPQQIREAQTGRLQLTPALGHQRHRSDENALQPNGEEKKRNRLWGALMADRSKDRIECSVIVDRFETALENYGKYSFVALVEYNCMMKAVCVYKLQRQYIDMETFHRDHVGKYLDDSFTRFDHLTKATICNNSAALYKEVRFSRKSSFFARLGVLFRLHVGEGEQRTQSDYKIVYPVLYKTLTGYGIADNPRENLVAGQGPVQMQIKALHEVYTAASRAELTDAAIRHLCHLVQVYYDYMDATLLSRLFDDLTTLVRKKGSTPMLNQRISVGLGNIILPPIQLTRFPSITMPEICALPPHLATNVIRAEDNLPAIFIYSPFQKKRDNDITWVVNCPCEVSVQVYNCRNVELVVRELCLLTEGCSFEAVPVRLILPAAENGAEGAPSRIKLIGVPRTPGIMRITGFSCEVLDMKNVCKLEPASGGTLSVNVLPSLAVVKLESSLPRAPLEDDQQEMSAETTVYSGQMFEHSLSVKNDSEVAVRKARLQVWQPKVSGGPSLIEIDDCEDEFALAPGETKEIRFRIFGIDPTATADDEGGVEDKLVETALPLASTAAEDGLAAASAAEGAHDLIPYTGRLLTCQFVVHYESDVDGPEGEKYERIGRLSLAVCIVPALTVSAWHVLPGDGPFSRYIVVDVTNSTDNDAELVYSANRRMNVLPKETCRVPLLSPCCSDVAGRAFYAATQKDSHMMQRIEVEKLRRTLERHVSKHLDIRWSIPAMELDGLVPVGALLSSVSLLKQLVLPAISLDIQVNSHPYISEDDLAVAIRETVSVKFKIISSMDYDFEGVMSLECYQEISNQFGTIDRSENLLFVSQKKIPFLLPKNPSCGGEPSGPSCEVEFRFLFRAEGIHKIRPLIVSRNASDALFSDEVFVSSIGFSVSTKASSTATSSF